MRYFLFMFFVFGVASFMLIGPPATYNPGDAPEIYRPWPDDHYPGKAPVADNFDVDCFKGGHDIGRDVRSPGSDGDGVIFIDVNQLNVTCERPDPSKPSLEGKQLKWQLTSTGS